jgi:hypothetical protein
MQELSGMSEQLSRCTQIGSSALSVQIKQKSASTNKLHDLSNQPFGFSRRASKLLTGIEVIGVRDLRFKRSKLAFQLEIRDLTAARHSQ